MQARTTPRPIMGVGRTTRLVGMPLSESGLGGLRNYKGYLSCMGVWGLTEMDLAHVVWFLWDLSGNR